MSNKFEVSHISYDSLVLYKKGQRYWIRCNVLEAVINKLKWREVEPTGRENVTHLVPVTPLEVD